MKFMPLLAKGALAIASLAALASADAQEFPARPIRIMIPYAGGGLPDPLTRVIGQSMAATLGQQVLVEQKPGAGGSTAALELIKSPADGYTLMFADSSHWGIQPALRPGIYDPVRDFSPIGMVARSFLYIVVREDLKVKSIEEFVALAKAKPGTISYGTSGNGSLHHLFMETVRAHYGIELVHVPFKGAVPAFQAFMAGHLPVTIATVVTAEPHMKGGTMRRLLASSAQRSRFVPDVPSLADMKIEGNITGDMGYVAPAGTPKPVIDKLYGALAKAVQQPDFQKHLDSFYVDPLFRTPEQFAEIIRADVPRYARVVKLSGAKATD